MLNALKMNYGKIENGRVIANGRNPQLFRPREKQPLVFSAGRLWDAAKNIQSVAKVAPDLPWQVCMAGEVRAPRQAQPPPAWTKECQVLGPLPEADVREWFASAAIYALPALYEPFGYTPLEAALSGCALVLGDIESLREIWDGAAVFVDPHNREALQTELMRLIQNCNYRREMSRRARVWGLHYSTERMGQNYLAAYSDLLAYSHGFGNGRGSCSARSSLFISQSSQLRIAAPLTSRLTLLRPRRPYVRRTDGHSDDSPVCGARAASPSIHCGTSCKHLFTGGRKNLPPHPQLS